MNRQAKCSNCGKWYYNHNGLFIVLPDTYDDRKCPQCNLDIEDEIKEREIK
jgi:hypothetical protein